MRTYEVLYLRTVPLCYYVSKQRLRILESNYTEYLVLLPVHLWDRAIIDDDNHIV